MAPSELYKTIKSTVETFCRSTDFQAPAAGPDKDAIRAITTSDYKQSWGHDYFKSSRPHLNKVLDLDGFLGHLDSMTPKLTSASSEITDITIDEVQRKAVVRATYKLWPKGAKEAGSNDLIWILRLDETGEKVAEGTEFIDGEATGRLIQLIKEGQAALNGSA